MVGTFIKGGAYDRLEDGTILVEERFANIRRSQRRTTRLWLKADALIAKGEVRIESLAGEERYSIERSDQSGYAVYRQEIDGWESRTILDASGLAPDQRFAVTALPLLLAAQAGKEVTLPMLHLDAEGVWIASIKLAEAVKEDDETPAEACTRWEVTFNYPRGPLTQIYQLAADGTLVSMDGFGFTILSRNGDA